jgi:hypothetical protein
MDTSKRGTLLLAAMLIILGVLFLLLNLIGVRMGQAWPVIFLVIAAVFYIPAFAWPEARKGLAALFIPGSVFLALGLIFAYTTWTGDYVAWAYSWTLIPAGVGLGLVMGGVWGGWGGDVTVVGKWMAAISLVVFALFATIFGGMVLKILGPVLLILGGLAFIIRTLRHSSPA